MAARTLLFCIAAGSAVAAIAFAAPPRAPREAKTPADRPAPPQVRASGPSGQCVTGDPRDWFGPPQLLAACDTRLQGVLPLQGDLYSATSHADVNGDGTHEYFARPGYDELGAIIADGEDQPGFALYEHEVTMQTGQIVQTRHGLVPNGPVASVIRANVSDVQSAVLGTGGFRDLDGDGDLDLVMSIWVYLWDKNSANVDMWFENTGMPASLRSRADLNRDGRVSGADLGLLVGEWGP